MRRGEGMRPSSSTAGRTQAPSPAPLRNSDPCSAGSHVWHDEFWHSRDRTKEAMKARIAALVATIFLTVPAAAQDWPARPVTMVVPFAAGGEADVLGRIIARGLSDMLGKPVVVENVAGGGGITGAARVARAAPDGYQFLFAGRGQFVLHSLR